MADRRNGVNGGMAIKVPCRVCSTSNITLSGEQTIDGVAVVSGDRVLVTGQTSGVNNGIYDCDTGTWSRAVDWDGSYDIVTGTLVYVTAGTSNSGWYYVATTGAITIGTTSVTISLAGTALASVSAYIQTLLNDADAATARTTLGAVGLTGNEDIGGTKTFTSDIIVNSIEIGRGGGAIASNTSVGDTALDSNTSGTQNSAFGTNALTAVTTNGSNSAFGYNALAANTGSSNSAFGSTALDSNIGGSNNTACGARAGTANTTGSDNTAVGVGAMGTNATASYNTAVGGEALSFTTGADNTATGYATLFSNGSGTGNSAHGKQALYAATGNNNSALGNIAGSNATTGSNNSFLGYNAQPSAVGVSNEITLGNSSIATLRCQVTSITALSDARDKTDVIDLPLGLDFINELRPVMFTWDRRDGTKKGEQEAGFIAQDLDAAQKMFKAEKYLNLVHKENPEKLEATPGRLLPILVKAIQELAEKNAELEERLASGGL